MNKPFDWDVDNEIFSQMLEFIEGMVIITDLMLMQT